MKVGSILRNNRIINRLTGENPIGIVIEVFSTDDRVGIFDLTSKISHVWISRECSILIK
jgi:hypothetical protein